MHEDECKSDKQKNNCYIKCNRGRQRETKSKSNEIEWNKLISKIKQNKLCEVAR